jgi:hypothetical protein
MRHALRGLQVYSPGFVKKLEISLAFQHEVAISSRFFARILRRHCSALCEPKSLQQNPHLETAPSPRKLPASSEHSCLSK